jgi:hypothetical protein
MASKFKMQVIECPIRKRAIETYTNSGNWFSPKYDIVACPAMYEGNLSCNRQCKSLLTRPPNHMYFGLNRV